MKLNIAYPSNGTLKQFEVSDDYVRHGTLFDHRLGHEVDGECFGPDFKGYTFKVTGGQDKQGFPMVHGVMAASRVALLIHKGAVGFNAWRGRAGERRRKSLRGCIIGQDIAVLNISVVRKGEKEIEGVTDATVPRRLGPKRAAKIRKLFNLGAQDDVRRFVVKRKSEKSGKKDRYKTPKVQRLITKTVKVRRARKLKEAKALLQKSAGARREYLSMISSMRMKQRQSKAARHSRKAAAAFAAGEAAMGSAPAKKAAAPKKK